MRANKDANPDKNCEIVGVKNGLGQPSLLEKTRHANLRHASKMKMVPISGHGREYKDGAQLQLTETFDGQCDIVESDAEAVELCTRSPLCDGFWRYNNTTHKNRTCFKTGARPATWNNTPSMDWSGRYFQRGYSDPDLQGSCKISAGFGARVYGTELLKAGKTMLHTQKIRKHVLRCAIKTNNVLGQHIMLTKMNAGIVQVTPLIFSKEYLVM